MSDALDARMITRTGRAVAVMDWYAHTDEPPPVDAMTPDEAVDVAASVGLLARLDHARQALADARTLADVGAVLDDVEKLKRYATVAKWTLDQQNAIARVWFLAQRKGGELLGPGGVERQRRGGDRKSSSQNGTLIDVPSLSELGLRRQAAADWQRYARMSERAFERVLDELTAEPRRLTTSGLLRYLDGEKIGRVASLAAVGAGQARVQEGDYEAMVELLDDESVDLLLTDPPYSTDVPDIATFARAWLEVTLPKVRRSGRAYICVGAYPHELHAYLDLLLRQLPDQHLVLEQVLVWTYRNTLGPSPSDAYKLNWQAILYLIGPEAPPLECPVLTEQFSVMDIAAPDGRIGTRAHAWQKPDLLAERLIRHAAPAGGAVLDPFAGTGTFLAAASRLGRRAIGSDVDPEMLAWCQRRGIEVIRAAG